MLRKISKMTGSIIPKFSKSFGMCRLFGEICHLQNIYGLLKIIILSESISELHSTNIGNKASTPRRKVVIKSIKILFYRNILRIMDIT